MATDPDTAKRRHDAQRGLMVALMDMEADMTRFEANMTAEMKRFSADMTARVADWKKKWQATYLELDEAMDRE